MMQYPAYIPEKRKGFSLDPRTKLLFMVLIATLMFVVYNNMPYICVLAGLPFLLLIVNGQKKTAVIYGSLFVLAVIANYIKDIATLPQLLNCIVVLLIALVLRLFPTFMMGYYIIKSTKADEFVSSMERWHVSKKVLIPIAVVFRFVPTMQEESQSITEAMRMRGIQFGTKKFWKSPGTILEYRLIPLLISVVKIGDELSAAALTRGLGNSVKRTNIAQIGFSKNDAIVLIISIFLLLWAFALGVMS